MTREELVEKTEATKAETHDALQMVIDELNNGQRKKLAKIEGIKALFERYGVKF